MNLISPTRRVLLATSLFALLTGGVHASDRIVGSGTVATEARQVSAFQGIRTKGAIDLRVRQSTRDAVEIRADDNVLPAVEATVVQRDGMPTLELAIRKGVSVSTRNPIVATVEVATLKSLAINGSGDAVVDGIRTADLQTAINGNGDIRLNQLDAGILVVAVTGSGDVIASGRADSLVVAISGSGDVTTRELQAGDVKVGIVGSGDAKVHARKSLSVSIAGSGDVAYSGDVTPTVSVAGSGSVKKL